MPFTVHYQIGREGQRIDRASARALLNCRSVPEAAQMAAHLAARDGWRGRVSVIVWTDAMIDADRAYGLLVNIAEGRPARGPADLAGAAAAH